MELLRRWSSEFRRQGVGTFFQRYGEFLGDHPYPFLIGPVLLTVVLCGGLAFFRVEDDLRVLYSSPNAPAQREYEIRRLFEEPNATTYIAVALEATDNATNLLTKDRMTTIAQFIRVVQTNLTVPTSHPDRPLAYGTDICAWISGCPQSNAIVTEFFRMYRSSALRHMSRIKFSFPIIRVLDKRYFLGSHFFGVRLNETSRDIESVQIIQLVFPVFDLDPVADAFETSLKTLAADSFSYDPGLDVSLFSTRMLEREIAKNANYAFPYLSVTLVLLVAFVSLSSTNGDAISSKPMEALSGLVSTVLAILSAAGCAFYCGVPYATQAAMMPFLTLAVGLDDTYVILGAWNQTDRRLSASKRLGLTLREAGSAITVTSVTNALGFGVGNICTTPAVAIFCTITALAMAFDYLYQLTFFAAIVALGGRREALQRHCIFVWRPLENTPHDSEKRKQMKAKSEPAPMNFFADFYARVICYPVSRILVLTVYVLYLLCAFRGCSLLKTNLTPLELLVDDSPLRHYVKLAESHIMSENRQSFVHVNRAPDFAGNQTTVVRFLQFVSELESLPYALGANSTQLWLRDYLEYESMFDADLDDFYQNLLEFLAVPSNKYWDSFLRWKSSSTSGGGRLIVDKFYFTTAFSARNWAERTDLLLLWRGVCAKYGELDAVVYDDYNVYSDQILQLPGNSVQGSGISFLCMFVVCRLFIWNRPVLYWVLWTLLSMEIGIIGFLSLWGADLSPTTIMNILMSIGLSVDFSTHVGYRIYTSGSGGDANAQMREALGGIGWPVLQGGFSHLIAIFVLQFVPCAVVRVFFRTTLLVVLIGLFHGLVVLPVILRTFTPFVSLRSQKTTTAF